MTLVAESVIEVATGVGVGGVGGVGGVVGELPPSPHAKSRRIEISVCSLILKTYFTSIDGWCQTCGRLKPIASEATSSGRAPGHIFQQMDPT